MIDDATLWELLTGTPEQPDKLDAKRIGEISWAKGMIENVPQTYWTNDSYSNWIDDYFLRIAWLKSCWLSNQTQGDWIESDVLKTYFISTSLVVSRELDGFFCQEIIKRLQSNSLIQSSDVDRWHPGMSSGSGWVRLYSLTLAGRTRFNKIKNEAIGMRGRLNKKWDEQKPWDTVSDEIDTADSQSNAAPIHTSAAASGNGRQIIPTEIHGEYTLIEPAENDAAPVVIENDNGKVIENSVFMGVAKALFVTNNLTEKERNILLHETLGATPTEIARRNGTPESDISSEANRISKQLSRSKKQK